MPLSHFDWDIHRLNREQLIKRNLAIIYNFLSEKSTTHVTDIKDSNEIRVRNQTVDSYDKDPVILKHSELILQIQEHGHEQTFHEIIRDDETHKLFFDIEQEGSDI